MKIEYLLSFEGRLEDGKRVKGYSMLKIHGGFITEGGRFTSEGLKEAKEKIEREVSRDLKMPFVCHFIWLNVVRAGGMDVLKFPYGAEMPMYDSSWQDPRDIGAVKP